MNFAKIALASLLALSTVLAVSCDFGTAETEESSSTNECAEHQASDWIIDAEPSCSAHGSKHTECTLCGEILETVSIDALAHTEVIIDGKAATCTEAGITSGKKCSVCDETILTQTTIPALEHVESAWITDYAATTESEGQKHKECTRCQTILATEAIPTISVDHVHAGTEWTVTKPATCVDTGIMSLVCECGETLETQAIAKSQTHTEETVLGKAATCTEAGTTDGKKCTVCGVTTVTQVPVAPKGHSFAIGVCTTCGFKGNYGVWITDGLGMPLTNIIVNIKKDGETVKMLQYKGQYVTFDLEDAEYTVELDLSGLSEEYIYDAEACVLSPDKKSLSLKLYKTTSEGEVLYVGSPIDADYNSVSIYSDGSYKVALTPNDYTFIVFTPGTPAIYTMTYECDSALAISYHGGSFFVQGSDISKENSEFSQYENGLAFSVYSTSIGMSYVFAIKSTGAEECILNIQNVGDPGTRFIEAPWTPYQEDEAKVEEMKNYPQEGTYTTIDLGDTSISAVLNPDDGYYHLNSVDGPVLFLDFTTDSKYIASIYTICSNQRMGAYIYDVDGNVVEKRSYNELFFQCGMPDPTTVETTPDPGIRVPMTEKLAEAIQNFGNNQGWWEEGSGSNIFSTAFEGLPFNREYAWLLYCGYYQ